MHAIMCNSYTKGFIVNTQLAECISRKPMTTEDEGQSGLCSLAPMRKSRFIAKGRSMTGSSRECSPTTGRFAKAFACAREANCSKADNRRFSVNLTKHV